MSRVIKFRAWHPLNKEMISFHKYYDKERSMHLFDLMADKHVLGKGLLMQFTGLQDNNGTDIYEGDILHQLDPVSWCPQPVCFHENSASYKVGMEQLTSSTIKSCELIIVGNTHQNPELLG